MTFSDQVDRSMSQQMLQLFSACNHIELDTAHIYNNGKTEKLLGELLEDQFQFEIATKVNPWNDNGLKPDQIEKQFNESLVRLKKECVDLLYLHAPDLNSPITETLEKCWEFFQAGKFKRFGLSNFSAWQVAEIVEICRCRGWMVPSVYQGMYNALTRDVERELFPCLRNYDISFYAYNPLAGGLLTGKHEKFSQTPQPGRFIQETAYRDRYWKTDYFSVLDRFVRDCAQDSISPTSAALTWLEHHSMMSAEKGDGIILGASNITHLEENLESIGKQTLSKAILETLDQGWEEIKPNCIKYFRP